jgi:hypothetical protein
MPEPHFSTLSDDLPRTLRRARDERDAREREANGHRFPSSLKAAMNAAAGSAVPPPAYSSGTPVGDGMTVTRIDVPFHRLVTFFMKAVFAALPAVIMLTIMLWAVGELLQRYFPGLLKMRILIQFPG